VWNIFCSAVWSDTQWVCIELHRPWRLRDVRSSRLLIGMCRSSLNSEVRQSFALRNRWSGRARRRFGRSWSKRVLLRQRHSSAYVEEVSGSKDQMCGGRKSHSKNWCKVQRYSFASARRTRAKALYYMLIVIGGWGEVAVLGMHQFSWRL